MSAFGDAQILQNRNDNGWMGIGGLILRDVAGTGNLTSTKVYGSVAYHQMLNLGSLLSLGFNVGYANKRINTENLTFPANGMESSLTLNKQILLLSSTATSAGYLDIQAGLNYALFPDENTYFNVGFSSMHVNRPRESFFDSKTGY
jgi:hypothetical protein